jgi:nucleoside-diphosphate-sugar epimerase
MAMPSAALRTMSVMMYLFDWFLPLPESYTGEGLRVIAGVTYLGNNSKAKRKLGYNPRPLRDGLTETVKHEMKLLGM